MKEPENHLKNIFAEAIEIEDAQQRAAFLSEACGENAVLRRDVEELIKAEAAAGRFLPRHPGEAGVGASPARATNAQESGDSRGRDLVTEKPGDRIGRYKLLQKIGEGGCGIVYMAQQESPVKRKVALKVIKLGMDTKSVIARFEAERQALAMMDHPNISQGA
jgi:eukaryotic-like serine/threonine-protein kinase